MTRRALLVLVFLTLPALLIAADTPAGDKPAEPDALALLKSIPVLTDHDEKVDSLLVSASLPQDKGADWRIRVAFAKPGRYSFSMADKSGTPILLKAEGRMLFFDYARQKVFCLPSKGAPLVRFLATEEGANRQFTFNVSVTDDKEKPGITVDVPSFFAGLEDRLKATPRDKNVVLSAVSADDGEVRAFLVPGTVFPCVGFEMQDKDREEPTASVQIEVNPPIEALPLALPDLRVMRKYVDVEEIGDDDDRSLSLALNLATAMTMGPAMSDSPEVRAKLEKALDRKIDWDAVKEFDRKLATALREAAKPAPLFRGAEKLGMTPEQEAKVREWLDRRGRVLDPIEFVQFLNSVLDARQRDILREIMKQPTNP